MFISHLVGNLGENRDERPIFVLCFSNGRDEIKFFPVNIVTEFVSAAFLSRTNCKRDSYVTFVALKKIYSLRM